MKHNLIGFIGCGHMAASLVGGLCDAGYEPNKIGVTDIHLEKAEAFKKKYGVHAYASTEALIRAMDVIVLCVKPQHMKPLMADIRTALRTKKPLIITIAAGIRIEHLEKWLGEKLPIVRAMPNTPAMLQSGASGLFANPFVKANQKDEAESILRSVGITIWLDNEDLMDPVTALSGSGPAYFFYLMEAMIETGIGLGLTKEAAHILVLQTAMGAAKMALESAQTPAELRSQVCSPGGTTEAALNVLTSQGFADLIQQALQSSTRRSVELGQLLGE